MKNLLEDNRFLSFLDYVIVGDRMYFSNDTFNAFVEASLATQQVVRMFPFEGSPLTAAHLHTGCIAYRDQIFFCAYQSSKIHVVDRESGEQFVIPALAEKGGFSQGILYQDRLYFLPNNRLIPLQVYDDETRTLQPVEWWTTGTEEYAVRYQQIDDHTWIGNLFNTEKYFLIDLAAQTIEERHIPRPFFWMGYDKGEMWYASGMERDIFCVDLSTGAEKRRFLFDKWEHAASWGRQYLHLTVADGKVFVVAGDCSGIYLLNQERETLEQICDLTGYVINHWIPMGNEVRYRIAGRHLIYTFQQRDIMARVNLDTLQVDRVEPVMLRQADVDRYINRINHMDRVILSEERVNLQEYLALSYAQ